MQGQFVDLMAAADYLGPAAVEVDRYQTEIFDIVRRRGVFGQRMKQVPATGHPSRFFEETAIAAPTAAQAFIDPPEHCARGASTGTRGAFGSTEGASFADQLQPVRSGSYGTAEPVRLSAGKDLADAVDGLLRTHDVALWNGSDTSLSAPTTPQYFGVIGQIEAGGNSVTIAKGNSIVNGLKTTIATMVSNSSYQVRPTAIYANPMLLDLIDQEMKSEFNVVLNTVQITGGVPVKALTTQAGELPLIPEWALGYTGVLGSGSAVLPAYVVTEDLIEYHWLTDPNPRVFKLGLPSALIQQQVVVKFGAPVVKGANFAHYEVKVQN